MNWISRVCIVLAVLAVIALALEEKAEACGCLSPPVPVAEEDYAVNQQAEQIIFEVEEGHVVAHVLIKYGGSPESFAWIVPVPNVPELALSSTEAFGLLDQATRPDVQVSTNNVCPESEYACTYHPYPDCPSPPGTAQDAAASFADAGPTPSAPPVEVIERQTIGSYDTVTFAAGDAQAAVAWLNQEGFIVNQTMAPFMQPYADAGMVFVASKLIPGADVSEIRPLRIRYVGQMPMIPLQLTAVAAEPHLTVTSYVYGNGFFRPQGFPLVDLDETLLSRDTENRLNYPMVLARAIDALGGAGFVAEYMGAPALPDFDQGTGCCTSDWDQCGIEWDGQCSCPGNAYDAEDCAEFAGLLEGVQFLEELAQKHSHLTRLTTRLSPEEMTFDPMFGPLPPDTTPYGRLRLRSQTMRLDGCEADIIEAARYQTILERQDCASLYCGTGECVTTSRGAGCSCDAGSVSRVFTDLDGQRSVTCVPDQAPVDLRAGGLDLPDACAGVDCGLGACVEVGGFATCRYDAGAASTITEYPLVAPCRSIEQRTGSVGAEDFSAEVAEVRVCAPPPPASCGDFGWLVRRENVVNPGESCTSSQPDPDLLVPPREPTCEDLGLPSPRSSGCLCDAGGPTNVPPYGGLLLLVPVLLFLRRRRLPGR